MMPRTKGLADFEKLHGQRKLAALEQELAIEREKVASLSSERREVKVLPISDRNTIRFALFGDTHFGNLYACPENLAAFFKAAKAAGCEVALHAGDVLDGWRVYRGQEFELGAVGFDAQLQCLAEAPGGLPVKFIAGNHDASFKNQIGISVGEAIERVRPDWQFLGEDQAVIELRTASGAPYTVGLYHMSGGTSYAVSYRVQKAIEQIEGGRKPQLAAFGHFHKADFLPAYRNVCAVQVGAFQWQTPFMQRLPTAAHVGGWIVEVTPGANYNRVRAEFISFYRERESV